MSLHEHGATRKPERPRHELADIVRRFGADLENSRPLGRDQRKVLRAVKQCRTAKLGGHVEQCDRCGYEVVAYNSCRNRHCPKCQALPRERWLAARQAELLPVGYFHVVFTLPHALNPLICVNKQVLLNMLFRAVSETLLLFGKNHLGGTVGVLAVLHTWNQTLGDHHHLHCLVPAGALSEDGQAWTDARPNYLFPVKALGKVFRGKYLTHLLSAYKQCKLAFPGRSAVYASEAAFRNLIRTLRAKPWVVYAKEPFSKPEHVLRYLGRYTHRVAISNERIRHIGDKTVTFSYRDRKQGDRKASMTLPADEFLRRFLLHALPKGFQRIRHYGLFANRTKETKIATCRALLGKQPNSTERATSEEDLIRKITGREPGQCERCRQGTMLIVLLLPSWGRQVANARAGYCDSS